MRIWIINHNTPHPGLPGPTRHFNLAQALIKKGHDVTIIAANFSHFKHQYFVEDPYQVTKQVIEDVPFIWLPVTAYHKNGAKRLLSMLSFAKQIWSAKNLPKSKPDVILGSSPNLFAAFSALKLANRLKVPFIFEVRDLWPETLIQLGRINSFHPVILLMKMLEKKLYRQADQIISLLPGAPDYIANYLQGDKTKIHWLPNFIDLNKLPNPTITHNEYFTIMYAGAHGLANGLKNVLDAALLLQQQGQHKIKLELIGDGPDKLNLIEQAKKMNLKNVHFIDALPKKDIYNKLINVDAFLFYLQDSAVFKWGISANKLFDYLGMGKPIIASQHSPYDILESNSCGISVKPNQPQQLADAMIKLANTSQQELKKMGEIAHTVAKQDYSLEKIADSLERILSNMLSNRSH